MRIFFFFFFAASSFVGRIVLGFVADKTKNRLLVLRICYAVMALVSFTWPWIKVFWGKKKKFCLKKILFLGLCIFCFFFGFFGGGYISMVPAGKKKKKNAKKKKFF